MARSHSQCDLQVAACQCLQVFPTRLNLRGLRRYVLAQIGIRSRSMTGPCKLTSKSEFQVVAPSSSTKVSANVLQVQVAPFGGLKKCQRNRRVEVDARISYGMRVLNCPRFV
jgi:hypothetical protein